MKIGLFVLTIIVLCFAVIRSEQSQRKNQEYKERTSCIEQRDNAFEKCANEFWQKDGLKSIKVNRIDDKFIVEKKRKS